MLGVKKGYFVARVGSKRDRNHSKDDDDDGSTGSPLMLESVLGGVGEWITYIPLIGESYGVFIAYARGYVRWKTWMTSEVPRGYFGLVQAEEVRVTWAWAISVSNLDLLTIQPRYKLMCSQN